MNIKLAEMLLKLGNSLPEIPTKYCKKCGEKLTSRVSDGKVISGREYSENTGEPFFHIERYLVCPKRHLKMKFNLVNDSKWWYTFGALKSSRYIEWKKKS
jgi:hypothetical protein